MVRKYSQVAKRMSEPWQPEQNDEVFLVFASYDSCNNCIIYNYYGHDYRGWSKTKPHHEYKCHRQNEIDPHESMAEGWVYHTLPQQRRV